MRNKSFLAILLAGVSCVCCISPAQAKEPAQAKQSAQAKQAKPEATSGDDAVIVVTAQRRAEASIDVSITIIAIDNHLH